MFKAIVSILNNLFSFLKKRSEKREIEEDIKAIDSSDSAVSTAKRLLGDKG